MLAVSDCVQFREEVKTTLEELTQGQQELKSETSKILDSESVREAQQLLLHHQVPPSLNESQPWHIIDS